MTRKYVSRFIRVYMILMILVETYDDTRRDLYETYDTRVYLVETYDDTYDTRRDL